VPQPSESLEMSKKRRAWPQGDESAPSMNHGSPAVAMAALLPAAAAAASSPVLAEVPPVSSASSTSALQPPAAAAPAVVRKRKVAQEVISPGIDGKVRERRRVMKLSGNNDTIYSVCFSPDGSLLAAGSCESLVQVWRTADWTLLLNLEARMGRAPSINFSPRDSLLAVGADGNSIHILNIKNKRCIRVLKGHSGTVSATCFSPDGSILASGSHDKSIRLWRTTQKWSSIHRLEGHTEAISSLCFSPDGSLLVSRAAYDDTTTRIWNVENGNCIKVMEGQAGSVCFSPDGSIMATGSRDYSIRLWRTSDWAPIRQLNFPMISSSIQSICFSPDGAVLAGTCRDYLYLWNVKDGKCIKELDGRGFSLCFSPDGSTFVSGSDGLRIQVWRTDDWSVVETLDEDPVCYSRIS
jgi:WD40 repeat protein